jgi:hypothetical protein
MPDLPDPLGDLSIAGAPSAPDNRRMADHDRSPLEDPS